MKRRAFFKAMAATGITTGAMTMTGVASTLLTGCNQGHGLSSQGSRVTPDFGPNVTIFDPTTPLDVINTTLQKLSSETQFSSARHAVFFKPGTYGSKSGQDSPSTATGIVNAEIGYYTAVYGLGRSPKDVLINGALHVDPVQGNPHGSPVQNNLYSNALDNFWRSLTNLTINPIQRPIGADAQLTYPEGVEAPYTLRWCVSQATPLRRVNIAGNLDLTGQYGAYAFGSFIANSYIQGSVSSGDGTVGKAQANWFTRNSWIDSWSGRAVNYVFSGVNGAPATQFSTSGITNVTATPVVRETPFVYIDDAGAFYVYVPGVKTYSVGSDWSLSSDGGTSIPIEHFYIAKPTDSATTINKALSRGTHVILTPGVYELDQPLNVSRSNTVVLGLGFPSLVPMKGTSAVEVGDVDGAILTGFIVDAGPELSDILIKVGLSGMHAGIPQNPTLLSDVCVRVGGARAGQATTSVEINNGNVILDNSWLWRADHGTGVGWSENLADHGLIVNADDVTALGLFVEHYQKHQVIWNGQRGRTVFYESELPKDPPSQSAWMNGTQNGYASYVVSNGVTSHQASGISVYSLFSAGANVFASSGVEAPDTSSVRLNGISDGVVLGDGGMQHVVNDYGPEAAAASPNGVMGMRSLVRVASFPPV